MSQSVRPFHYDANFVAGRWLPPETGDRLDVEDPWTRELLGSVPDSNETDADAAVAAAREALPRWRATSPDERARWLGLLADALESRQEKVAEIICQDVGTVYRTALGIQAGLPIMDLRIAAECVLELALEEEIGNSLICREPVGVVAAITPWNYPLHQITAKVGGALAAGCTVVVKPSEVTPLAAFAFAEVIEEIGLPPGVINLVCGRGATVGAHLASTPDVDMVSFTGSVTGGRQVSEVASQTNKRVVLELGGKSANVLLPGADYASAVKVGVANAFLNQGQTCSAWTRMLVPSEAVDECVKRAAAAADGYRAGPPLDPKTKLGPLVSATQRSRVLEYISGGESDGARLVTGGAEPVEDGGRGYFVRPTIFADVQPQMRIAREEIFGPVLSILEYRSTDEALRIANDSDYGLAAGVWAGDEDEALAFARELQVGQVDLNGARFNPRAPFGGVKSSGYGRELGRFGIEEFLVPKAIQR
jgi:aldehyde dehydrogenase (NAD+)